MELKTASYFLTWNVIKGVIGCWVGSIDHSAFCEIAPIANINLEIVRAGARVGAICCESKDIKRYHIGFSGR